MEDFEEMPESERALAREVNTTIHVLQTQKLILLSREGKHRIELLKKPLGGAKVSLNP